MTGRTPLHEKQATITFGQSGETPLGRIWLAATKVGLAAVAWGMNQPDFEAFLGKRFKRPLELDAKKVHEAGAQMVEYLNGKRQHFTILIDWTVLRPFQQMVLRATYDIPYGETRTYREIATQIGHPHAARAVGGAEARNPMPLVLPCHRVIGRDGRLHGYGMGEGIKTKEWLLKLEGAFIA
jgi:methylated-DNA-[protein]-cysteine S-methyltransferase